MAVSPYAQYVGTLDPVSVLRSSLAEYQNLIPRLAAGAWNQPYAPGKWTVRQIMVHVSQWEMIFGVRLLCAVGVPGYVVQPVDQDQLMGPDHDVIDGATAWAGFEGARKMNLAFAGSLTAADRQRKVHHSELGEIDVEFILVTLAGHGVHHLKQLQPIAAA